MKIGTSAVSDMIAQTCQPGMMRARSRATANSTNCSRWSCPTSSPSPVRGCARAATGAVVCWAAVNGWRMNDQGWDELILRDRDSDIHCRIEYLPDGDLRVHGPESSLVVQVSSEKSICV